MKLVLERRRVVCWCQKKFAIGQKDLQGINRRGMERRSWCHDKNEENEVYVVAKG